jgi:hypothetical protein
MSRASAGLTDGVVLASAGSLTAFVELTKSWLSRDPTRSLKVSWSGDGELESVELSRLQGAGVFQCLHCGRQLAYTDMS